MILDGKPYNDALWGTIRNETNSHNSTSVLTKTISTISLQAGVFSQENTIGETNDFFREIVNFAKKAVSLAKIFHSN